MTQTSHNARICLWFDHDAEEAASFYVRTFPDSTLDAVHRAPGDFPGGRKAIPWWWNSRCSAFPAWA